MQQPLFDTTVVIDLANGQDSTMAFTNTLLQQYGVINISTITAMETLVGARNKTELKYLAEFLTIFKPIRLTPEIDDVAVRLIEQYRLAYNLSIPDALIAATALVKNLTLFTDNMKDYTYIKQLDVQKPF